MKNVRKMDRVMKTFAKHRLNKTLRYGRKHQAQNDVFLKIGKF